MDPEVAKLSAIEGVTKMSFLLALSKALIKKGVLTREEIVAGFPELSQIPHTSANAEVFIELERIKDTIRKL